MLDPELGDRRKASGCNSLLYQNAFPKVIPSNAPPFPLTMGYEM